MERIRPAIRRLRHTSPSDLIFLTINYTLLVLFFLIVLYPMLFVLSASFSDPALVASGDVVLLPKGFTLDGYRSIFQYRALWIGYANTIFYTIVGTAFNLLATLPCAYALSRKDMPGRNFFMTLFIIIMYFGGGLIPSYLNIQSLGLLDTRWLMLLLGLVSSYNLIVSRTFFTSIPYELQEAAGIDGCSDFGIFIKIMIPLSKPIIAVLTLYYAIGHWNSYFDAMIYLSTKELFPLQLFLRQILIQSQITSTMMGDMAGVDAATIAAMMKQQDTANLVKYGVIVVSTIPMMIIYPWFQKFFAKGVMIGSLKG